jgi:hypothetical protein
MPTMFLFSFIFNTLIVLSLKTFVLFFAQASHAVGDQTTQQIACRCGHDRWPPGATLREQIKQQRL